MYHPRTTCFIPILPSSDDPDDDNDEDLAAVRPGRRTLRIKEAVAGILVIGTPECCNPDLYSNLDIGDVKAKEDNAPLKWSNLEEALRLSSSNDIHQFL
jgi:hypothetical protein